MSPGFLAAGPFGFFRIFTSRPDGGVGTSRLSTVGDWSVRAGGRARTQKWARTRWAAREGLAGSEGRAGAPPVHPHTSLAGRWPEGSRKVAAEGGRAGAGLLVGLGSGGAREQWWRGRRRRPTQRQRLRPQSGGAWERTRQHSALTLTLALSLTRWGGGAHQAARCPCRRSPDQASSSLR